MIPFIFWKAKADAKTFTHVDSYTTRCGYSMGQIGHLTRNLNSFERSTARGGPVQQAFLKPAGCAGEKYRDQSCLHVNANGQCRSQCFKRFR